MSESEINRLQRMVNRLHSEGLNHKKLCQQFTQSLEQLERQLSAKSDECLQKQTTIDKLTLEASNYDAKVHHQNQRIKSLEGKLTELQQSWFLSDQKSERLQLQELRIQHMQLEEEYRLLMDKLEREQQQNQLLKDYTKKLEQAQATPVFVQSTSSDRSDELMRSFDTIKIQYNNKIIELNKQLTETLAQHRESGAQNSLKIKQLEDQLVEKEIRFALAEQKKDTSLAQINILTKEIEAGSEKLSNLQRQSAAIQKELQDQILQKNEIINQKCEEIKKLQQELNNSGSFLVDTINNIFPNHLEEYLEQRKSFMELQKENAKHLQALKATQRELEIAKGEIAHNLPIIEQFKAQHDQIIKQVHIIKQKLEIQLQNNGQLEQEIQKLRKTSETERVQLNVFRDSCQKYEREITSLHILLRKLKSASASVDISAYNKEFVEQSQEYDTIYDLVKQRNEYEMELNRLSQIRSVSNEKYQEIEHKCSQLQHQILARDRSIDELTVELAKLTEEKTSLEWALKSQEQEEQTGKQGPKHLKEIQKIKKNSERVSALLEEKRKAHMQFSQLKHELSQEKISREKFEAEVRFQTEQNQKLSDLNQILKNSQQELFSKLNSLERENRSTLEALQSTKIELQSLKEFQERLNHENQSQRNTVKSLQEENSCIFRQYLDQQRKTDEVREQLKLANKSVYELTISNNETIHKMNQLKEEYSKQDQNINARIQIENQNLLIYSAENEIKCLKEKIVELQAKLKENLKQVDTSLLDQLRSFIKSLSESEEPSRLSIDQQQFSNQEELKVYIETIRQKFSSESDRYQKQLSTITGRFKESSANFQNEIKKLQADNETLENAMNWWKQQYEQEVIAKQTLAEQQSALSKDQVENLQQDLETKQRRIDRLENQLQRKIDQIESLKQAEDEIIKQRQALKTDIERFEKDRATFMNDISRREDKLVGKEIALRSSEEITQRNLRINEETILEKAEVISSLCKQLETYQINNDPQLEINQKSVEVELRTLLNEKDSLITKYQDQAQRLQQESVQLQIELGKAKSENNHQEQQINHQEEFNRLNEQHRKEIELLNHQLQETQKIKDGLSYFELDEIRKLIEDQSMLKYLGMAKSIIESNK